MERSVKINSAEEEEKGSKMTHKRNKNAFTHSTCFSSRPLFITVANSFPFVCLTHLAEDILVTFVIHLSRSLNR